MSSHELERVAVMGRVKNGELKLSDAAVMLEVSYRQAKRLLAPLSQGGQRRAKAWQCGSAVESTQAIEATASGVEFNRQEVFGFGTGKIRSDIGGRALSRRRRHRGGPRNAAAVDAGSRAVESAAEAQEAFETAGAESPFWRTGATGWQ